MLEKLQNMRKNLKKKGKGFTLVELIVVIVVIAIIAAIAIPRITSFQDSARKARIQAEHRELVTAAQMYIANDTDPTNAYKKITGLEELKKFMNVKEGGSLADTLAKDGETPTVAHKITGTKIISTFTPAGGGTAETMEYDFGPTKPATP